LGRRVHAPRRGSLAYYPRVRALRIVPRIRRWPKIKGGTRLLGFAAYKVGMTHSIVIEDNPASPFYGRELIKAVTVLEAPPLFVFGVRAYVASNRGLQVLTEVLAEDLPKDLKRVMPLPNRPESGQKLKIIESRINEVVEVRVLACTQPRKSGLGKKSPEVLEIKVGGGTVKEQFEYAKSILGKEVKVHEVFKEGQYVDVIAVTKGKGFQGVVKRFGVKILTRWHKHRKGARKVGAISPQHPSMLFTVPRPGQLGFHTRTEYNKRILKIGSDPKEVNVKGGFVGYGVVKSDHIILEGSVPGPRKRLVRMRFPIRMPEAEPKPVKVVAINLDSKQGV